MSARDEEVVPQQSEAWRKALTTVVPVVSPPQAGEEFDAWEAGEVGLDAESGREAQSGREAEADGQGERGEAPAGKGSFGRNTVLMAVGTLVSRFTGFAKILALAWVLGGGRVADAYNLANSLPNSVYDLILGGVLSATMIPVFVEEMGRRNPKEGWRAISAVVSVVTVVLVAMSVLFYFLAPSIMDLLLVQNHGAVAGPERTLAIHLLRLFVPQVFLLGGIAVTTALLNARGRFGVPGFSPILANVTTVAAIVATDLVAKGYSLTVFEKDETAILVLGLGTTAGYLVQMLAHVPELIKEKVHIRPVWNPRHPAVNTVLRLSLWTLGAVATNQVSFYVVQILAGSHGGDITDFNYAYTFFQLPYGIFAVSIASVIAPDVARLWSEGKFREFQGRMAHGMRLTLAFLVPVGVGFAFISQAVVQLGLKHGHESLGAAHMTGVLVAIFALGLPGFSVFLFLQRGFQSMKDTRSMFWLYVVENGITVIAAVSLYQFFSIEGLVAGWVGSYSIGAVVSFLLLSRKAGGLQGSTVFTTGFRVAASSAAMAAVLEGLYLVLPNGHSILVLAVRLVAMVLLGGATYVLCSLWLGVAEVKQVVTIGGRRRSEHQ